MTRFVRILPLGSPAGARFRLELLDGVALLADETVHPEHVDNPDAHHYETHDLIEFTPDRLRWLHFVTGEALAEIDRQSCLDGIPQHEPTPAEEIEIGSVDGKFDGSEGSKR